ncbi:MAG TPA: hypothetical protein DHW15_09970 [Bacteroidetes bacterium]|jgi:hypothetical protein|nr:hypothetical protein [Bacteroidota bacterium]
MVSLTCAFTIQGGQEWFHKGKEKGGELGDAHDDNHAVRQTIAEQGCIGLTGLVIDNTSETQRPPR